ncbi:MAG: HTH domain-containing protein [Desulfurococcales archaeon]|nr:HTH domain-containing protein [Desulfurococcales archaeon]
MSAAIKVTIDLELLAMDLYKNNKKYITIQEIARRLGVSERTAGKVLSRLERLGFVKRYSSRAYELLFPQGNDRYTFMDARAIIIHKNIIKK